MHTQPARKTRHLQTIRECSRPAPHAQHPWRETTGKRARVTCPGVNGRSPETTIRLRPEAFTPDALAELGWETPTAAAKSIGVHSSTLRRAIAGQIAPGERLIAALIVGAGKSFDSLFHVVAVSRVETSLPYIGSEVDPATAIKESELTGDELNTAVDELLDSESSVPAPE